MNNCMSPRDAFGKTLAEIGERNEKVFVVNADLSTATKTDIFGKKLKDRSINVGNLWTKYGGLYSAVCEVTASEFLCTVKGLAVMDHFGESGSPKELYEKYGLTVEDLMKEAEIKY